jgi:hypothetical protein
MWADNVDQWLQKNSIRGGHSPDNFNDKLLSFGLRVVFYISTVGIGYLIVRALRTKESWYYEDIFSKKDGKQDIESPEAKEIINAILEKEMVTFGEGEKALFLIKDQTLKRNGILLTNKRMIYALVKPNFTSVLATDSGQLLISELSKKISSKSGILNMTIIVGKEEIGKLDNSKPNLVNNFLECVRKSLANESFA